MSGAQMNFPDYITRRMHETGETQENLLRLVQERIRSYGGYISRTTLMSCANGMKLSLYQKARLISDATDGVVSVQELCE
jgi:hypothetical protein